MTTFFSHQLFFLFIFSLSMIAKTHGIIEDRTPNSHLAAYSETAYKTREVHNAIKLRVIGEKEHRVFLFVPAKPGLKHEAPIVFFHHGWQGMNPMNFGSTIDHLVRSGHVVIYPVFQDGQRTVVHDLIHNAAQANRIALNILAQEFGLSPQQGQTLYYGFSIGAAISVNLALSSVRYGLPPPNALFLLAPGDAQHLESQAASYSFYSALKDLPATLPVVLMASEDDDIGLPTAKALYAGLTHIPRDRRILYILPSSQHRTQKVVASHGSPGAPDSRYNSPPQQHHFPTVIEGQNYFEKSASLNQLDFFGYWKIMNALLDALKSGKPSELVFAQGTEEQLTLGTWPDGTPLRPMRIEEVPAIPQ